MKKFAYWDKDGTHTIEADAVTVKRKGEGLQLKFKAGATFTSVPDCICLTELMPEVVLKK